MAGTTRYMNGVLGVSQNSYNDTLITIIDINLNTKWIVSIDTNNTNDMLISTISDENIVYSMTLNSDIVSCLFTLNYTTGEFIKSKWYQHYSNDVVWLSIYVIEEIKMLSIDDDNLIIFLPIRVDYSKLMFCKFQLLSFYSFENNFGG